MSVVLNLGALPAHPLKKIPSLVAFYPGGSPKHPDDKVSFHRIDDPHENIELLIARIKDSNGRSPPAINGNRSCRRADRFMTCAKIMSLYGEASMRKVERSQHSE